MEDNSKIHITSIISALWSKRKVFFIIWPITFVLSCIIIFPQPRYYVCEVSIAPESADAAGGSLSSLASNFGINIGNGETSDAIYPELYPDLFISTDFTVELLDIKVTRSEDSLTTDYYDYLKNHQKKNILTLPFVSAIDAIKKQFKKAEVPITGKDGKRFDSFHLTREVSSIVEKVQSNIQCNYSKTTNVVTISVKDQDPVICAMMADSVKEKLQKYITEYRTKKARIDYSHYKKLLEEAESEYSKALGNYASYSNSHRKAIEKHVLAKNEDNSKNLDLRYQTYSALLMQLQTAEAKIQERTPAFTTLKCATVPVKPAGPKRMFFVAAMLVLSSILTASWLYRKELIEWF